MEINNQKFIDAVMTLTEMSREDRVFLAELLAAPHLTAGTRKRFEHMNKTLVTYEEIVREMAEQQMQIEEGLDALRTDFIKPRDENPPPNET